MAGKPLSQHVPDIEKALDKALGEHLLKLQKQLGTDAPKDTGRFASSWFIGQDAPNRSVRGENWANPGDRKFVNPGYEGRIEYDGTWYVSNSLPYAERASFDPTWAKGGASGAGWFTAITNQIPAQWNKISAKHLKNP